MDNKGADLPPSYPANYPRPDGGQPVVQYSQSQPYPGQQPYGQQQYTPGAPPTVIVVNQPHVQQEFQFPNGKLPSVVLLICAMVSLICYIAQGVTIGLWFGTARPAGFVFYGIAGLLGAMGSYQTQRSPGIAIGTIVMAVFALITAFAQSIQELMVVIIFSIQVSYPFLIMMLVGICAFILCILLIVFASQTACDCCRTRR